ncbi:MAG: GAF domain-containing protein [Fimbriimonadaceae bacterium]
MVSQAEASLILDQLEATPLYGRPMRHLAMRLLSQIEGYHWCGVYRLEGDELVLDEFVGTETDHQRIPVGRGVCGTAVSQDKNQIVDDVRKLENYLSCSAQTRSEIVVLIKREGEILGQIDIDGHDVGAFDRSDEQLLEAVGANLAMCWEDDAAACEMAKKISGAG